MTTKILSLILFLSPFFVSAQTLNVKEKEVIFNNVKTALEKHYHFKEQTKNILTQIDKAWKAGHYNSFNTREDFTNELSKSLKEIAKDNHLNFFYTAADVAKENAKGPEMPWGLMNSKFLNNGLNKVEILPGDVGYMRIQAFGWLDEVAPSAFGFLADTKAMIIDLRGNGGGMLSNLVASYLLPEDSIHLITIFWNDRTDSIFTYRKLNGPRYLDKPVYLLTDKGTFSSAEEFTYDLQALKRVTVVGESTGGGANPGGLVPVHTFSDSSRLDMFVSMAHVENAITKSNWEGRGIQPDVVCDPGEALTEAHTLALKFLIKQEKNPLIKKQYEEIKKKI